ncbi:MAG: ComF family protein [Pseudomonadota bacterium]
MAEAFNTPIRALKRFWPTTCKLCGCRSDRAMNACSPCLATLPKAEYGCARCALVLPHSVELCGGCLKKLPAFDRTFAAFVYRQPVSGLIQRFKFSGDLAAGRVLAQLLAAEINISQADLPELMIPVPLYRTRQWRRGFNQAELICRDLHKSLGIDWLPALKRIRATQAQSDLPAKQRAGNVRGAFIQSRIPNALNHVVLVDDVMTTGTTLNECARMLKKATAARVDVWVIARA